MIRLSLQLFGGRGASSGGGSKGKSSVGGKSGGKMPTVKKKTAAEINSMTRKQAVAAAKPIFIRNNMRAGLSEAEATRRFNALVDGNTTAQLKKYIKRNQ